MNVQSWREIKDLLNVNINVKREKMKLLRSLQDETAMMGSLQTSVRNLVCEALNFQMRFFFEY